MHTSRSIPGILSALLFATIAFVASSNAQQPTPTPETEVEKIGTDLAQTSVLVFDKRGRRVDDLRREDFELLVDGKPTPIDFFENVIAGSDKDRKPRSRAARSNEDEAPTPRRQARTIIFFVDDFHFSLTSVNRTRSMLLHFIQNKVGPDDLVVIASPSGRVGFLQQFTNNKDVLRAAASRIAVFPQVASDYIGISEAPMTEYNALSIERRDDNGVFDFYVQHCILSGLRGADSRQRAGMKQQCETEVRNRARQVVIQAGAITDGTYSTFEQLLRTASRLPGSKLAFFISDGFLPDSGPRGRVSIDRLPRIANAARESGVVIYSIDARGLISGALDATGAVPSDPDGRLESANLRAIAVSQDAMNALAVDTGGRALRNQNDFDDFVSDALAETERFYLIAWVPVTADPKDEKLRSIDIRIVGRPDLTVRSGRNFGPANMTSATQKTTKKNESGKDAELKKALSDEPLPGQLGLSLAVAYVDAPATGPLMTTSVEIPADRLSYGATGTDAATVTIAGVVLNDQGKTVASFGTGLKVAPPRPDQPRTLSSNVIYNYPATLKPGIYQIRTAGRDDRTGAIGSAHEWIVIPDLAARELTLSSIFVGFDDVIDKAAQTNRVQWSVDKTFSADSKLNFLTFVYNSVRGVSRTPDLNVKVSLNRDGREVVSVPHVAIGVGPGSDPDRIPLSGNLDLRSVAPGRYVLRVTVEDRVGRKSVSRTETIFVK